MYPLMYIFIGIACVLTGWGIMIFLVGNRRASKPACMENMSRYIENMKRLGISEWEIDEELKKIADCRKLKKLNKEMEKALNKYNI